VLARHPELRGVHDLRTRTSGNRDFVQFHVWVDGAMTVTEAHRVMDEIEDKLHAEFPDVEILIHPDPEGHVDESGVAARTSWPIRLRSVAPVKLRDIGQPLHQRGAFRAVGLAQAHDGKVLIGRDDDILPQMADAGKDAGRAAGGNSSSLPSGWGRCARSARHSRGCAARGWS
jgi:hypothetical protein